VRIDRIGRLTIQGFSLQPPRLCLNQGSRVLKFVPNSV
jgi:hypothetical protein